MTKSNLVPLFLAILSMLVLVPEINVPLTGYHDWNSVFYGNIARNHMRLGLATTKLGLATNIGYFPHAELGFYNHHPILLPIIMALSFFLFGVTAFAARILPILSLGATVFFLSKLVIALFRPKVAVIASGMIMVIPLFRYYGLIPVNETIVLGFASMTIWWYYHWYKTQDNKSYFLSLVALFLAQLTGWGGYYLSLYLPLHAFTFARNRFHRQVSQVLGYGVVAAVSATLFIAHNLWLSGWKALNSLQHILLFRMNLDITSQNYSFTYPKYFIQESRWLMAYFSHFILFFSSLYLLSFVYRRLKKRPITPADGFIMLYLAFGSTQLILLPNHAFIHEYDLIYLVPFICISAAVILSRFKTIVSICLLVIVAINRQPFLDALKKTRIDNPGYLIGSSLNHLTKNDDKILILNTEIMQFYDVYLNFYADRQITAQDNLASSDLTNYDYIVIPSSHDYVSPKDKYFLQTHFTSKAINGGILFNTKEKP